MDFDCLYARRIHPATAGLAAYISEIAGACDLPPRRQFEPHRLPSLLDYLYLIEVLGGGDDYFCSLAGRRVCDIFGAELRGSRLSEMVSPDLRQSLKRSCDRVVASRQPLFVRVQHIWPRHAFVAVERLLIPMTASDGKVCTICGVSVPISAETAAALTGPHEPAQLVSEDEAMAIAC